MDIMEMRALRREARLQRNLMPLDPRFNKLNDLADATRKTSRT